MCWYVVLYLYFVVDYCMYFFILLATFTQNQVLCNFLSVWQGSNKVYFSRLIPCLYPICDPWSQRRYAFWYLIAQPASSLIRQNWLSRSYGFWSQIIDPCVPALPHWFVILTPLILTSWVWTSRPCYDKGRICLAVSFRTLKRAVEQKKRCLMS